tara:strand:+ start:1737 stop:2444 length:708 start_codon:yes stop_codon:yes gene_type:complete
MPDRSISNKVTAFLPCRKGSERVPRKNIRQFGSFKNGLLEIKLGQLLDCALIETVVLSTNDEDIITYAESLKAPGLVIHQRAEHLCTSMTSTDDLVEHALSLIPSGHILWTHVTSPFVSSKEYEKIVSEYLEALHEGYDSLMTTTQLHAFLWNEAGPLNYDRQVEKWPRTQTLTPVHEVNSAAFLASADVYSRCNDRIGDKPKLLPLGRLTALDIDWEEDFVIAEQLLIKQRMSV